MATASSQGRAYDRLPRLAVRAEYVKDFSFRNPYAPQSPALCAQPALALHVDVSARPLSAVDVEVELRLEGEFGEPAGAVLYRFGLAYAGIFGTQDVPRECLHSAVMIEGPRLLFPAARDIVSFMVRSAGFPAILIDPVDFAALYEERAAAHQQKVAQQATPSGLPGRS
jgi:preprotein translocase subunit SecB